MSDPTRDHHWTATAAGGSHPPHPALRTLWALGGGPLAFVRADEALADRLQRLAIDVVPDLVQDDGKAIQALATTIDLTRLQGAVGGTPSDSAHEPNDDNAGEAPRQHVVRSSLLPRLRQAKPGDGTTPSSASSPSSAPRRVDTLVAPDATLARQRPSAQDRSTPKPAKGETLPPPTGAPTLPRWPRATPVTAGRAAAPSTGAAVRAVAQGVVAHSPLAMLPLPSSAVITTMLAGYVGAAPSIGQPNVAATAAARLLEITERVERRIAAARDSAVGGTTRQAVGRRGRDDDSPTRGAPRRPAAHEDPPVTSGASRGWPRGAADAAAPAPRLPTLAPTFGALAEAAERRGFRGLAMRATAATDAAPGERAPMLQPLYQARLGWDERDGSDAWSLDAAARSEGLDLDEVAS